MIQGQLPNTPSATVAAGATGLPTTSAILSYPNLGVTLIFETPSPSTAQPSLQLQRDRCRLHDEVRLLMKGREEAMKTLVDDARKEWAVDDDVFDQAMEVAVENKEKKVKKKAVVDIVSPSVIDVLISKAKETEVKKRRTSSASTVSSIAPSIQKATPSSSSTSIDAHTIPAQSQSTAAVNVCPTIKATPVGIINSRESPTKKLSYAAVAGSPAKQSPLRSASPLRSSSPSRPAPRSRSSSPAKAVRTETLSRPSSTPAEQNVTAMPRKLSLTLRDAKPATSAMKTTESQERRRSSTDKGAPKRVAFALDATEHVEAPTNNSSEESDGEDKEDDTVTPTTAPITPLSIAAPKVAVDYAAIAIPNVNPLPRGSVEDDEDTVFSVDGVDDIPGSFRDKYILDDENDSEPESGASTPRWRVAGSKEEYDEEVVVGSMYATSLPIRIAPPSLPPASIIEAPPVNGDENEPIPEAEAAAALEVDGETTKPKVEFDEPTKLPRKTKGLGMRERGRMWEQARRAASGVDISGESGFEVGWRSLG
ncbi:hypothetical protein YB2330_000751 [Saitoella coloradoensis]